MQLSLLRKLHMWLAMLDKRGLIALTAHIFDSLLADLITGATVYSLRTKCVPKLLFDLRDLR